MVNLKLGKSGDSETIASGNSRPSPSLFPLSSNMPKRSKSSNQNTQTTRCQVEGCNLDLVSAKDYHRRHKICETHSKSPKVIVAGLERRFCQQCSRFHSLSEFDDMKRSCRRRLSDHNARRRRPHPEAAHFSPSGFSSSIYDGRFQNFLLSKTPTPTSNATWESFCSFKMGQAGNSWISPLVHTDRKLNLPQKYLNIGKNTSATSSDLDEAPVFPRALSLLSISSCGLSGMEPCSIEQIMQGHTSMARPVMQLQSQNWPIISSEHLPKEQIASTSSINAMDVRSTDGSSQFKDFLSFKTSYNEPDFYHSS